MLWDLQYRLVKHVFIKILIFMLIVYVISHFSFNFLFSVELILVFKEFFLCNDFCLKHCCFLNPVLNYVFLLICGGNSVRYTHTYLLCVGRRVVLFYLIWNSYYASICISYGVSIGACSIKYSQFLIFEISTFVSARILKI